MDHTSDIIFFVDSSTLGDSRLRVGPGLEHLLSTWDLTHFVGREGFMLNISQTCQRMHQSKPFLPMKLTTEMLLLVPRGGPRPFRQTSTCLHAINFRVLCGANVVTSHPEIEGNGSCVVHLVAVQLFNSVRCEKGFN